MMILRRWPRLSYFGAWTVAFLYNFSREALHTPWPFLPGPLAFNLAWFSIWSVLGLLSIRLLRRYPLRMDWRPWAFHLALAVVLVQIDITAGGALAMVVLGMPFEQSPLGFAVYEFKSCFHVGFMHYLIFCAIIVGLDAQRRAQRRELQAEELRTAFVRAQLQSLKSQLRPHFLFNTLHAIASLMHYDVPTAERMLTRLSDLLRMSLRETDSSVVSLKQEIAFTEAYLDIEKIRFEQRLDVTWLIPENLQDSSIPPFILQPLVENAIKFSVAPHAAGGNIIIRAYTDCDHLLLEVEDDAPEPARALSGFGIGLANIRARLETIYGSGQRLELLRAGTGTIARIGIPLFKFEPVAA